MAIFPKISSFPEEGALMAIDPGEKNWGIAISDPERKVSSPLLVIKRTKFRQDLDTLLSLYEDRQCVGLVVGLPLNMNGSMGRRGQSSKAFVYNLLKVKNIPIFFFDERLTSKAAERPLLAADLSRKRRAEVIDKIAASLILQTALDQLY